MIQEQFSYSVKLIPRQCAGTKNIKLHSLSMFAVKVKIYGVLYNQSSSIFFDGTLTYWSVQKSS